MVYASLQEAWGIEAFSGNNNNNNNMPRQPQPPENPYVVKDAAQNPANYGAFQQKNQFKSSNGPSHSQPRPRYFVPREEDEYSQVSAAMAGPIVELQPQQQHHQPKNSKIECVSMITHLQSCKLCSAELSEHLRNVFIKEFILFAGSGIIMFLFLDLLRKIAQKA
jgi:hypothetical protein